MASGRSSHVPSLGTSGGVRLMRISTFGSGIPVARNAPLIRSSASPTAPLAMPLIFTALRHGSPSSSTFIARAWISIMRPSRPRSTAPLSVWLRSSSRTSWSSGMVCQSVLGLDCDIRGLLPGKLPWGMTPRRRGVVYRLAVASQGCPPCVTSQLLPARRSRRWIQYGSRRQSKTADTLTCSLVTV